MDSKESEKRQKALQHVKESVAVEQRAVAHAIGAEHVENVDEHNEHPQSDIYERFDTSSHNSVKIIKIRDTDPIIFYQRANSVNEQGQGGQEGLDDKD